MKGYDDANIPHKPEEPLIGIQACQTSSAVKDITSYNLWLL